MPARSQVSINQLVARAKSNVFSKMMSIGKSGTIGVPIDIPMARQLNLIWATESLYTTLSQKNVLADQIGKYGYDIVSPDGVFSNNTFVTGF